MKRFVALGIVGVLMFATTGCGGPDSLFKEYIANVNALADSIEKKESKEKIQAVADRMKATQDKIDKLKLSDSEKESLKKKYEKDLEAAMKRLLSAILKVGMEGGGDNLPKLDNLMKK